MYLASCLLLEAISRQTDSNCANTTNLSSLARSGKKVLHVDQNSYYGEEYASLTLSEFEAVAAAHAGRESSPPGLFTDAHIFRPCGSVSSSIATSSKYLIALGPHLIYTSSRLLDQLISTKMTDHLEFLAVGPLYVFRTSSEKVDLLLQQETSSLFRVPCTREDVFAATGISPRSKRQLIKVFKFAAAFSETANTCIWHPYASLPLISFLSDTFELERPLGVLVSMLTLSLDGALVSTSVGLAALNNYCTSIGRLGPGFAAVYAKWGGFGEIIQAACRAQAVGGGIYVLGTGVETLKGVESLEEDSDVAEAPKQLMLNDGTCIATKLFVSRDAPSYLSCVERAIFILPTALPYLFQAATEGAPVPAVTIVAFPPGSLKISADCAFHQPVYASIHSSDTGECPPGQCKLVPWLVYLYIDYLSSTHYQQQLAKIYFNFGIGIVHTYTRADKSSVQALERATYELLALASMEEPLTAVPYIFKTSFRQSSESLSTGVRNFENQSLKFSPDVPPIVFSDDVLIDVERAWQTIVGPQAQPENYMVHGDMTVPEN